MSSDIKEIKTDVAGLKTDVADLKVRMERVENRLEAVFEQTAGPIESKYNTEKTLNYLLEQQISLSHIAGEHEVAIHTLQRRVSKQEIDSDVKDDISIKLEPEVSEWSK